MNKQLSKEEIYAILLSDSNIKHLQTIHSRLGSVWFEGDVKPERVWEVYQQLTNRHCLDVEVKTEGDRIVFYYSGKGGLFV